MSNLLLKWTHEEIKGLQTAVICEMWDKRGHGRIKREFMKTFNEKERIKIAKLYHKFYDWNFRSGIPIDGVVMSLETFELIKRAANFFGTV